MDEQPQNPPNVVMGFKGLNNRIQPTALGLEWQLQANNVLCDDAGYLVRRPGVTGALSGLKDAFGTRNGRLLAIDSSDRLIEISPEGEFTVRHSGVTGAPFQWTELGYALFLMSTTAQWAVYPNRVIEWGSLCPASSVERYPLGDPVSYPPPVGDILGVRRSQIAIGVWEPDRDRSVIYFTRSDFPHEVVLERDFLLVSGRITLLAGVNDGLLIGTDRAIFVDGYEGGLQKIADYGAVLGGLVHEDRGLVYFWTSRGLCRGLPFEAMNEAQLIPILRESATAGILPCQGSQYAVIHQSGQVQSAKQQQRFYPLLISTEYAQGVS
jgi:hypothetical protein